MPNEFKVKNGLLVSGSTNINSSGSSIFTIDGTSGRLFSVDDSLSGSLFSVNTAAGLPVIEAFSDNTVRIGQYGQRALFVSQSKVGIGKESALNGLLDVSGSITVTGSVNVTGSITGSLLGTASFAVSASWAPGGGAASSNLIFSGSVTASVNVSSTNAFNVVSASNTLMQVTPNRTLLVGDATQIPNETAWKSPGVFGSGSANKVLAGYLVSTTNGATIGANNFNFTSWADLNIAGTNLIFRSSETEYMRLTSAGNFGIGVTSPGAKLHVAGAVSASNFTGSLLGTASFATSASWAPGGGGASFPYTGSAVITGSLVVTGSSTLSGSLTVNSSTITVNTNGDSRVFASTFRPTGASGQNIFIGHAGTTNSGTGTSSSFNTSVGAFALDSNTTGFFNTAFGNSALDLNTAGSQNTAVGYQALQSITTGTNNTAIGGQALSLVGGSQNVAIGSLAGINIAGFATASVYVGYNALGLNSGISDQTNNEIVIGANNTGLGSNTVVLGNSSIVTTILRGRVGIGTTSPTVALEISAGSIKAGTNSSTEGTVILQDSYSSGNLTNFGTNRSGGGAVISYASIPSPVTTNQFVSTFSSAAARSAIIVQDNISFYTTGSQTITSGSAVIMAERVRIADTGQLSFFRYTATSSFPGTVAAILAVDSNGNVITTAASGSAGGGGSGIPGGANTTIQFNDSNTFSGSGNFTFTKATNTVRIQASGSALLVISGSQGELLRIQDSGSSPGTLATISSGSRNVLTVTTSSVVITGSLDVSGSFTASLQSGFAWVGDSNGRAIAISTSSIGGGGGAVDPKITAAANLFLFYNY
jgi:hypothetical protein